MPKALDKKLYDLVTILSYFSLPTFSIIELCTLTPQTFTSITWGVSNPPLMLRKLRHGELRILIIFNVYFPN